MSGPSSRARFASRTSGPSLRWKACGFSGSGRNPCTKSSYAVPGWNCTSSTRSGVARCSASAWAMKVFPVPGGPWRIICFLSCSISSRSSSHSLPWSLSMVRRSASVSKLTVADSSGSMATGSTTSSAGSVAGTASASLSFGGSTFRFDRQARKSFCVSSFQPRAVIAASSMASNWSAASATSPRDGNAPETISVAARSVSIRSR